MLKLSKTFHQYFACFLPIFPILGHFISNEEVPTDPIINFGHIKLMQGQNLFSRYDSAFIRTCHFFNFARRTDILMDNENIRSKIQKSIHVNFHEDP